MNVKDQMIEAIIDEIRTRAIFFPMDSLDSIYFGGGTPSLLTDEELKKILAVISEHYTIKDEAEITLEANPDDLAKSYLYDLKKTGINRLSIGVQSFFDDDLLWMNRSHNSKEAFYCIQDALEMGFNELTIDLIFGAPSSDSKKWELNIKKAIELKIPHLSCYGLTVEPNTALSKMIALKKKKPINEEDQASQFNRTMEILTANDYHHYEISNYCLQGKEAKHNSNYWLGKKYLGVGPSAHSYDGACRYWNVANNIKYIDAINNGSMTYNLEKLKPADRYNEYVMTRLRTKWGCTLVDMDGIAPLFKNYFEQEVENFIKEKTVQLENEVYTLTSKGKMYADRIASSLFYVED